MPTDASALHAAWRALGGGGQGEGWQTIAIGLDGPCAVRVGRRFPGDEEAVLAGFPLGTQGLGFTLPEGRGFRVERVRDAGLDGGRLWVALSRQSSGNLDLFAMMAADIIGLVRRVGGHAEGTLLNRFVGRIRAWQEFMQKDRDGVLGPEAEVGLFGELVILRSLADAGMPMGNALDCWEGPLDSAQDFLIGPGAIEVKATIAAVGFPANIGSLEQLDDSVRQPIYLAGVRLGVSPAGMTLPGLIAELRDRVTTELGGPELLDSRLLHAGFNPGTSDRYSRHFTHVSTRILVIDPTFPRLIRAAIPVEISRAKYTIDLDLVTAQSVELPEALAHLREA